MTVLLSWLFEHNWSVTSPDTRNLCTNNEANIIFSMLSKKTKFYLWRNFRIFIIKFEKKKREIGSRCSYLHRFYKIRALKNFANFTKKIYARVSLLIKAQAQACKLFQKKTLTQVFSFVLCKLFKNIFL